MSQLDDLLAQAREADRADRINLRDPMTATPEILSRRAERHVYDRLREALDPEFTLFPNVAWVRRDHGVDREGEADVVIAHPELGFLTIEVKSGPIARDGLGRGWAGEKRPEAGRAATDRASRSRDQRFEVASTRSGPPWGTAGGSNR